MVVGREAGRLLWLNLYCGITFRQQRTTLQYSSVEQWSQEQGGRSDAFLEYWKYSPGCNVGIKFLWIRGGAINGSAVYECTLYYWVRPARGIDNGFEGGWK